MQFIYDLKIIKKKEIKNKINIVIKNKTILIIYAYLIVLQSIIILSKEKKLRKLNLDSIITMKIKGNNTQKILS